MCLLTCTATGFFPHRPFLRRGSPVQVANDVAVPSPRVAALSGIRDDDKFVTSRVHESDGTFTEEVAGTGFGKNQNPSCLSADAGHDCHDTYHLLLWTLAAGEVTRRGVYFLCLQHLLTYHTLLYSYLLGMLIICLSVLTYFLYKLAKYKYKKLGVLGVLILRNKVTKFIKL
jgi:hypothetical protein